MKRVLALIGPTLFLLAEIILPGGSADPATRMAIIQNHGPAWALGHLIIALALVFLLMWVGEVYGYVRPGNELTAFLGLFLSTFALASDYAVAMLQLLALELVRTQPATMVLQVLETVGRSSSLLALAFLPTLGFFFGFGLLAIGVYRKTRQILPASLLTLAGLLIAVAGVVQIKIVFVLGALALFVFALLFAGTAWRKDPSSQPAVNPAG